MEKSAGLPRVSVDRAGKQPKWRGREWSMPVLTFGFLEDIDPVSRDIELSSKGQYKLPRLRSQATYPSPSLHCAWNLYHRAH